MTTKLPADIRQAIEQSPGVVRLEDEQTHAVYVVIDEETHLRAMRALRKQEDFNAIQAGIEAMESGHTIPLAEADEQIRQELGFRSRKE